MFIICYLKIDFLFQIWLLIGILELKIELYTLHSIAKADSQLLIVLMGLNSILLILLFALYPIFVLFCYIFFLLSLVLDDI